MSKMRRYQYKGHWYTLNELSEMSGVSYHTLAYRLRKGWDIGEAVKAHPVNESVYQFSEASWYEDWIGMPINDLHKIYWKWCISQGYTPLQVQGFSRYLFSMFPNLKSVPNRTVNGSCRVIRER